MNNLRVGKTVWYDDAGGRATKCVVDAIEPAGVWLRVLGARGKMYFEKRELGRLRSTEKITADPLVMFRNLLARIHRDGGHHTEKVGLEQSFKDADERVATLNTESDARK